DPAPCHLGLTPDRRAADCLALLRAERQTPGAGLLAQREGHVAVAMRAIVSAGVRGNEERGPILALKLHDQPVGAVGVSEAEAKFVRDPGRDAPSENPDSPVVLLSRSHLA